MEVAEIAPEFASDDPLGRRPNQVFGVLDVVTLASSPKRPGVAFLEAPPRPWNSSVLAVIIPTMVSPQEQAFRNVLTTRAATVVVGVLMSWPIVAGLGSALEYLLVIASPRLPPFAVRATLLVFASLIALALLLRGLHLASLEPRPDVRRLTRAEWWAIAALVVASLAGSVALVWFPRKTAEAIIDLWGSEPLLAYGHDTATLVLLGHGVHAVTMSGAFVYSAARWDAARRRGSPNASPV